jgi:arginyl-tRNA synthetase
LIRDSLQQIVASAVARLVESGKLPGTVRDVRIEISDTKQPEHGDFACNFAMVASKAAGMNPRQIGEILRDAIPTSGSDVQPIDAVEVAGPGFLNFRLNPSWVASFVPIVLGLGEALPKTPDSNLRSPKSINVEFVSVNPNGPITIGSGRGAAYGSTLCNVLEAVGNRVHREYYINDGVNSEQMRLFSESVRASILGTALPENGYKGDHVSDAANTVIGSLNTPSLQRMIEGYESGDFAYKGSSRAFGERMASVYKSIATKRLASENTRDCVERLSTEELQRLCEWGMTFLQANALEKFETKFDTWFNEQSLHDSGAVAKELDQMLASGVADESEYRTTLKLAKGGVIEEVIIEDQAGKAEEVDDDHDAVPETPNSKLQTPNSATLWLRSTKFGDDMDRVLRRRDGRLTYIASDVAYHKDKLLDSSGVRGTGPVDKMITILGPDHHGYIGRLQAVVAAMLKAEGMIEHTAGDAELFTEIEDKIFHSPQERDMCHAALEEAKNRLEVQIFQLVRFMKDGKPAPMRKRDGNIYALIDLVKEIGEKVKPNGTEEEKLTAGKDVARFFYLMRSHDTTFDFDLDLAEKQSDENPVFYVQYAHARICSVIAKAEEAGFQAFGNQPKVTLLSHERELSLIKKVCDLPFEVQRCAEDYEVHRLTTYAIELARTYHHFYEACRVIQTDQPELSQARIALCQATRIALKGALDLLGVSAPERMDRTESVA